MRGYLGKWSISPPTFPRFSRLSSQDTLVRHTEETTAEQMRDIAVAWTPADTVPRIADREEQVFVDLPGAVE